MGLKEKTMWWMLHDLVTSMVDFKMAKSKDWIVFVLFPSVTGFCVGSLGTAMSNWEFGALLGPKRLGRLCKLVTLY